METTRRAATPEDEPFLRELFIGVRTPEFLAGGLSADQARTLLEQQYDARCSHYASAYPHAVVDIFLDGGVAIGSQMADEADDICLIDIALTPAYRGRGIGTAILKELLDHADAVSKRVVLHVEQFNPAYRLYERFGFKPVEMVGIYWRMEREPAPAK